MKLFSLCIFLCLFAQSCKTKKGETTIGDDFESLMGAHLPAWEHVQTKEDFQNLAFFKQVYEENIKALDQQQKIEKIPHIVHFIWVGPNPFPRESVENVRSWMAHHPDWTFKFWTDRQRALPHPDMELCLIEESLLPNLATQYHSSNNYGEKSDLFRLEILFKEGGIYADHDVACVSSFDSLNSAYDLFCGLEVPYPTSLSSSVLPTNNLIGSRKGHPVIAESMQWLRENWDQIERDYPGQDKDAVINRVAHRTFLTLGLNFKKFANQMGNRDIALPSFYFNAPKIEWAKFAQHQYKGTWFENESAFERNTRKRLMMLSKKTNKMLLALSILGGINVLGFTSLGILLFKRRRLTP